MKHLVNISLITTWTVTLYIGVTGKISALYLATILTLLISVVAWMRAKLIENDQLTGIKAQIKALHEEQEKHQSKINILWSAGKQR